MICTIVPVNLFATEYDVFCGSKHVAKFKKPALSLKSTCSITMNDKVYSIYREGVVSGDWILEQKHAGRVAVATKPSFLIDSFAIQYNNKAFQLKSKKLRLTNQFIIYENDQQIGRIYNPSFFSRKLQCAIDGDSPLEFMIFAMYLASIIIDRRSSQ
ncbi:MAG TPA: hypothetical protein PLV62_12590 [Spirochaetota bacterium]|nr:hypothetical protein [Spirochaetota bacterium]